MRIVLAVWFCVCAGRAAESDALAISANIQARHIPFVTLLDPLYASSTSTQIIGYTRCGDSALWTGALLAAESFRYGVTKSADALKNVKSALAGLKALADVTGDNRLARCIVPADSVYAANIANEEASNTVHQSPPWIWVDNTSRDQVVGAFFGLGVAFDVVDDPEVKAGVSDLATRLIGFISRHQWSPNDDIGSTFQFRPEELQTLLQVARHVNPANTVSGPLIVLPVATGVAIDVQSNSSYFKFNLDYLSFYHLVRLQDNDSNRGTYGTLRSYTASHQNAFFNMIDRALRGPDAARDAETRALLDQWLLRSRRDFTVDVSSKVAVCGSEACQPVPVALRPPATFLWEVDPFHLQGGGSGIIENAGVDYILPYWMARYYGVITSEARVQSAAAPSSAVAPGSLASFYGGDLAAGVAQADSVPLPQSLGGVTLTVTDSAGVKRTAPLLYVSPGQINFVVPDGTAAGTALFAVAGGGAGASTTATVQAVAPTLFSMNGTGSGVAAALAVAVLAGNPQTQFPVPVFQCGGSGCVSVPIDVGVDRPVYLSFYGTGIRNLSSPANVTVTINGVSVPVLYAGAAPDFVGLDQVNTGLPLTLRGGGEVKVVLTVDGQSSNAVTIHIQ
jgi:uncharacterized protein (TIGR03437 family)